MIKAKSKKILGLAFAALAGVAIVKGYFSQNQNESKTKQNAYVYTSGKDDSESKINGKLGNEFSGLEYKITDFNNPKISVEAKPRNGIKVNLNASPKSGKAKYGAYFSSNNSTIDAKIEYGRRSSKTQINANKNFDTWINSVSFNYLENYGKQEKLEFNLGFDIFNRKFSWAPSYDFKNQSINLGFINRQ